MRRIITRMKNRRQPLVAVMVVMFALQVQAAPRGLARESLPGWDVPDLRPLPEEPADIPAPAPVEAPAALPAPQPAPAPQPVAAEAAEVKAPVVLGYGHFSKDGGAEGMSAEQFARQMDYLQSSGLHPISLQSYIDWREGRRMLPSGSVLITLDEADRGAYEVAYPILKKHHFAYVVFVDGRNFADGDPERATLAQLQEMAMNGAEIGSHTVSRPGSYEWQFAALSGGDDFSQLVEHEIGNSTRTIAAAFGTCRAFSYPHGTADEHLAGALPNYGISVAFTSQGGHASRNTQPYAQYRCMVKDDDTFHQAVGGSPATASQPQEEPAPEPEPVSRDKQDSLLVPIETVVPAPRTEPEPAVQPEPQPQPQPRPEPQPVVQQQPAMPSFADDDVAEEVEEVTPDPQPAPIAGQESYPAVQPLYENLGRRTPDGDWVTSRFTAPLVPREQTRVAVLGYHNFSNTKPITEMRMRTSDFCQQMQYIKDAGLSVITMQDFLEWLNGTRCLPERCVLITIDDGWKSVYTDAFPVLRAYGYPFTMFLYTTYIDVQGDSMTQQQLRAMMRCGATIGSHSVNHLYPKKWKRYAMESEPYKYQLQVELLDSRTTLLKLFGNCSTYCYPGGYNTPPMLDTLSGSAYQAAFTVEEAKVECGENPLLVHRYMVFGNDHNIFRRAVNFDGDAGVRPTREGIAAALPRAMKFYPHAFPKADPNAIVPAAPAATAAKPKPKAAPAKAAARKAPARKKPARKVPAPAPAPLPYSTY